MSIKRTWGGKMKNRCQTCRHDEDVHAPENVGGCAIIYRKDGNLKSCHCTTFSEQKGESGPPRVQATGQSSGSLDSNRKIKPTALNSPSVHNAKEVEGGR